MLANIEEQQFNSYNNDIVDIKKLFMNIWKRKVIIIIITLVATFLSFLYNIFFTTPEYYSNLNIIINMPEFYHTKYGDYTLPLNTNQQYIDLITSNVVLQNTIKDMNYASDEVTVEELKKRIILLTTIDVKPVTEQNYFEVKVIADDPDESQKLANVLYDNYIDFLNTFTKECALIYFNTYFSTELKLLEESLNMNQKLLSNNMELIKRIPQESNLQEALNQIRGKEIEYIVMRNVLNQNYTVMETVILEIKQNINELQNSKSLFNNYLNEIQQYKNDLYSGDNLETKLVSIVNSSIYLACDPSIQNYNFFAVIINNILLSTFFGCSLTILGIYIKLSWLNNEENGLCTNNNI